MYVPVYSLVKGDSTELGTVLRVEIRSKKSSKYRCILNIYHIIFQHQSKDFFSCDIIKLI